MIGRVLRCWLLAFIGAAAAAATNLTLDNPALFGMPGDTVGWGFTLESTPILDLGNMITPSLFVTFADFVPDAGSNPVGLFTPFITQLPESNTVIGSYSSFGEINPWTQAFDNGLLTGIGSYLINDFQSPGDQVSGTIVLYYDMYRVSPNAPFCIDDTDTNPNPCFDPAADTIAVGQMVSAPASVTVMGQSAAPEPGTLWMLTLSAVWLAIWMWFRGISGRSVRPPTRRG